MKPILLCMALIRGAEAIRKRYPVINGRRLQRFYAAVSAKEVSTGGSTNRKKRRADGKRSDFRDVVVAMRSTERAFQRTA